MTFDNPITIMLVDDHAVVRAGIRRLLEQDARFTVLAETDSGERAYQFFGEVDPDITIMDLNMPGIGGLEAISRILTRYPQAKILVLSMHENAVFASQALKAGALGYVAKTGLAEELLIALEQISQGQTYMNAHLAQKIAQQNNLNDVQVLAHLSAREFEIFRLLADGQDVVAIGKLLNISAKTAANYQTSIKQKLGLNNSVELVRLALRCGLIET